MTHGRTSIVTALLAALLIASATAGSPAASATLIEPVGNNLGSGYSVAMSADGSRIAAGSPTANTVDVYDWNGTTWTQAGASIAGEAGGGTGHAVALSADGDRLAVGDGRNDGNGTDAGHVRIYDWNGTTWTQAGTDIDGEAAGDWAGYTLAMSADGSRIAVGARFNGGSGADAGHVRIYDWNGTTWTQAGTDIDGEAAGDESSFGLALSADGSRVVIGATESGSSAGHVRVYDWNGTTWTQAGTDIDGEATGDRLGWAVAASSDGNRIAIGAPWAGGVGANAGHVRIYDWNGTTWTQAGTDIDGEPPGSDFGWVVATSADGTRIAGASPSYLGNQLRVFVTSHEPAAPPSASATAGDEQAAVSWTVPGDDGGSPITGYTATASPGGQSCSTITTTDCTITGLTNGVEYAVSVTATNAAGTSADSIAAIVTPVSEPDSPTGVSEANGDQTVIISWTPPSADGGSPITGYTASAEPGAHTCMTTGATNCTIDGLTNGVAYTVTVTATNAIGIGPASVPITTSPATRPDAPHAVEAIASDQAITASWTAPTDDGGALVTGYTVTLQPGGHECTTTALTCSIRGLTNGRAYAATVTATNRAGTSPASTSATATPTQVSTIASIGHDCGQVGHHPFTDVLSRWDREISCLFELGITTGVTDTVFAPDRVLSREEAAAFIARTFTALTGKPCGGTHPFADTPATGWNGTAVGCLWHLELTTGTSDTTFSPLAPVNRQELAAFLQRLYTHITGKTCTGTHPFTDTPATGWNGTAVGCLWHLELTTGTSDTTFSPDDPVTRLQAAIFIARLTTHLT